MRRPLLAATTAVLLLLTTGGWAAAQDASPEPGVSPDPAASQDPGTTPAPEQLAEAEERLATATYMGKPATIVAIDGFETIGTPGADVIVGTTGDDVIRGEAGDDRICAGPGADTVSGGAGKDRLDGGLGDDTLDGGAGNDTIHGGAGRDDIRGGDGDDKLTGNADGDVLAGGPGKDTCTGGKGIDWLPSCNEKHRTRGTVVLTKNKKLKGPHTGRFEIAKNGVTLDCGGHTVTGPGPEIGLNGVRLVDRRRVTVRNCDLRGHFHGIWLERADRNKLLDNRVWQAVQAYVLIDDSDRNRVLRNTATDSTSFGFGIYQLSDSNVIEGNVVDGGAPHGGYILLGGRENSLRANEARDGGNHGFLIGTNHLGQTAVKNTIEGNSARGNAGLGFNDDTTGFRGDAGTDNWYSDNTCVANQGGDSSPATLCD